MSRIALVVAVSRNGIIGRDGKLPWHVSGDLKLFKQTTMGKPVVMGRKTWEGLPRRPLPGRLNIVVTRQRDYGADGATVVADVAAALGAAGQVEEVAVIGGGEIFREVFPMAHRIYLTEIDLEVEGDTQFPKLAPGEWREVARETHPAGPNDSAGFVLRTLDRIK
jgi:dihydrofolate reductase